jgi:hypothetical protein
MVLVFERAGARAVAVETGEDAYIRLAFEKPILPSGNDA